MPHDTRAQRPVLAFPRRTHFRKEKNFQREKVFGTLLLSQTFYIAHMHTKRDEFLRRDRRHQTPCVYHIRPCMFAVRPVLSFRVSLLSGMTWTVNETQEEDTMEPCWQTTFNYILQYRPSPSHVSQRVMSCTSRRVIKACRRKEPRVCVSTV